MALDSHLSPTLAATDCMTGPGQEPSPPESQFLPLKSGEIMSAMSIAGGQGDYQIQEDKSRSSMAGVNVAVGQKALRQGNQLLTTQGTRMN